MSKYVQLHLTCKDKKEVDKISKTLLEKKLVACVKMLNVNSKFAWNDRVEKADEVLVLMDTKAENFDEIEKITTKIHSYDTFVLLAFPIEKVSKQAKFWLDGVLK